MNRFNIRYFLCLLMLSFIACSDEETTYDIPETPEEPTQIYRPLLTYSTFCTEEKLDSDAQTVTAKQTFSCQDSLLTQLTYEQSFTAVEPITITQTNTLTYLADKVIVTDDFGNTLTYLLNQHGCAESCTLETNGKVGRQYYFFYDEEYHLSVIEEYLPADNFEAAYARIAIKYLSDNIHIAYKVGEAFQTFTGSINTEAANHLAIPSPFLAELHPLSMHTAALYAQILGNAYPFFIKEILPEESEISGNKTTYQYVINETGIPTDCFIQTICNDEKFYRHIAYRVE